VSGDLPGWAWALVVLAVFVGMVVALCWVEWRYWRDGRDGG
jgi:hypothetical protein